MAISTETERIIIAAIDADLTKIVSIGAIAPIELYSNLTREGFFVRFEYTKPSLAKTTRWLCFNEQGAQIDCDPKIEDDLYQNMVFIENLVWNT
jgi:hypothetical protein